MFLLKSLYYTVIISNTLDYLFQYLLQSFYDIFMLCAATCTRSVPFFADTCTHSVPIFYLFLARSKMFFCTFEVSFTIIMDDEICCCYLLLRFVASGFATLYG